MALCAVVGARKSGPAGCNVVWKTGRLNYHFQFAQPSKLCLRVMDTSLRPNSNRKKIDMGRLKTLRAAIAIVFILSGTVLKMNPATAIAPSIIRVAESPGANPNYLFPYMQCAYFSTSNINQFQHLIYRPLYWYGLGKSTSLVPSLSLANAPVFNKTDTTVTIKTKGWRFHGGQVVNGLSVMFFLNMWVSDPVDYCAYVPNHGIPEEISSASARGNVVTITFRQPVNPNWIIGNFLSLVTPMPEVWDRTTTQSAAGCSTGPLRAPATIRACRAVVAYLQNRATNTAGFTSPFWQAGTDGPWLLRTFNANGDATFTANPTYSGKQKPAVSQLKEIAYQSTQNIIQDLVGGKIDLANLSYSALVSTSSTPSAKATTLSSISKKYNLTPAAPWTIDYFPFNFNPADPKAAIVAQPYVRQAMQYAIDQASIVTNIYDGYAVANLSPLPLGTPTTVGGNSKSPYSYDLVAAQSLLTSHGWSLQAGVMTCAKPGTGPGECGGGVALGQTLALKLIATGDSPQLNQILSFEIAAWHSIGIAVTLQTDTSSAVMTDCGSAAGFELCAWSGDWSFFPSNYPSGEDLFVPSGIFDIGSYNNPQMTALVGATMHTRATLETYSQFVIQQAPILFQPTESMLLEGRKALRSSIPIAPNPENAFTPEYYHF